MKEVNEFTAAQFSDNYAIFRTDGDLFVACEHNETEAKDIARYLTNYHGCAHEVRRNRLDQVRRAHEIRGTTVPVRYPHRDDVFKLLGTFERRA